MNEHVAIRVESLSKKFIKKDGGEFWALKDISFEVRKGEVLGIVGKNGAGKSTLLEILGGIQKPSTGTAEINGKISSIFGIGTGFHPDLTGRQNIFLNGTLNGLSKKYVNDIIDEIIAFSELDNFIDEQVKDYSMGMYMRLAFSIFAFLKPEVLLLDEVFSVGDITFQNKCSKKIKDLVQTGATVLIVSHSLEEINITAKKVLILEKGIIIFNGSVFDGIQKYAKSMIINELSPKSVLRKNEIIFTPPLKSSKFELNSIKLSCNSGNEVFSTEDEIKCVIEYELKQKSSIYIRIALAPAIGNDILFDCLAYRRKPNSSEKPPGNYSEYVLLPQNTFHKGIFFISVIMSDALDEDADKIEAKKVLSFEVRLNDWQNKKSILKSESTPLNPKLKWL